MIGAPLVTVGFSTHRKNFLSWLIRKITGSRFSHCWVRYYHPLYDMSVVVEAELQGNIEVPYDRFVEQNDEIVELIPPIGVDPEKALIAVGPRLGLPYDIRSLFGRLIVYFFKWLGKKIKNPLGNPKKDACVELVVEVLQAADASLSNLDPEVESPETLYEALLKSGWGPVEDGFKTRKG